MLSEDRSRLWDAMKIGPQWLLRPIEPSAIEAEERARPSTSPQSAPAQFAKPAARTSAPTNIPTKAGAVPPQRGGSPVSPARALAATPRQKVASALLTQRAVTPLSAETLNAIKKADWEELNQIAQNCRACQMGLTRQQAVLVDGSAPCDFVVIGEAPGQEEDLQGKPFVGNSGRLLTAMLASIGFSRPQGVTIINVLKCRPPENRNPESAEIDACEVFLQRQMELLKPKVVLLSGRFATMSLLGLSPEASISSQRGRIHEVNWRGLSFKVVVTYHPSYLLRRPQEKSKAWDDLLLLKRALQEEKVGVTPQT